MDVQEAIFAFDGRSVADLKAAARAVSPVEAGAVVQLCSSEDPLHRVAATWVVKAVLDAGQGDLWDLEAVFGRLEVETAPDAVLHLLQSVQHAPRSAVAYAPAVEAHLGHKKTLVAVWAMDAFVRIALDSGDNLARARDLVEAALGHNKASMRARARHLAPLLGL